MIDITIMMDKEKYNNSLLYKYPMPDDGTDINDPRILRLSDKLKNLRLKKEITYMQLATYLKVSVDEYISYENGSGIPSENMINKIAEFYGIFPNYLLGIVYDDDERSPRAMYLMEQLKDAKFSSWSYTEEGLEGLYSLWLHAQEKNKNRTKIDHGEDMG